MVRLIYLPLLRPVIGIAIIPRILIAFELFDIIYALTAGGPGIATENLALLHVRAEEDLYSSRRRPA